MNTFDRMLLRLGLTNTAAARLIGCSVVTATLLRNDKRQVSALLALRVEAAFPGEIRAERLPMKLEQRKLLKLIRGARKAAA